MLTISKKVLVALIIVFVILIIKAYYEDNKCVNRFKHHSSTCPVCLGISAYDINNPNDLHGVIVNTMMYENKYGRFSDSKFKKILINMRDQIIRGALMGAVEGSWMSAVNSAVVWSLTGGIVTALGDRFGWNSKMI